MKLTKKEAHILLHSLGIRKKGDKPYRNHFMTGEGTDDWPIIQTLINKGLMKDNGSVDWCDGDHCFVVTEAGKSIVKERENNV